MSKLKSQNPVMEPSEKKAGIFEYYETSVALIKALIWPIIVLYFFSVLRGPIISTFEQLPYVFQKTTQITIAGVTLEIDQRLQVTASVELREALANLSANALRELVHTGEATQYNNTSYDSYREIEESLRELEKVGLITLEVDVIDPKYPDQNVRWKATELGVQAYRFVVNVMIEQLLRSGEVVQ